MTPEELKELLNDSKNQEIFKELAKEQGFKDDSDIEGLKNKNIEIILANKRIKKEMADLQKTIDEIDLDEYNELKSNVNNNGKNPDLSKVQRDLEKLQKQLEQEQKDKHELRGVLNSKLKETTISKALDKYNIDKAFKTILLDAFSGKAEVEDTEVFISNGNGSGQPADDFFKEWVASDAGKVYLAKPTSTGTGSQFSQPSTNEKTVKRADFDSMPLTDQRNLVKEGTQIID